MGGEMEPEQSKSGNDSRTLPIFTFNASLFGPDALDVAQPRLIRVEAVPAPHLLLPLQQPTAQAHEQLPVPQPGIRPQVKVVLNVHGLAEWTAALAQPDCVDKGGNSATRGGLLQLPDEAHLGQHGAGDDEDVHEVARGEDGQADGEGAAGGHPLSGKQIGSTSTEKRS